MVLLIGIGFVLFYFIKKNVPTMFHMSTTLNQINVISIHMFVEITTVLSGIKKSLGRSFLTHKAKHL